MPDKTFFDMSEEELMQWIDVPIELIEKATNSPLSFLRDSVALPTEAINPFILDIDKIQAALLNGLFNPFDERRIKFDDDWRCGYSDSFPRYIHVDLGRVNNPAALTMVHAPEYREVEVNGLKAYHPVIKADVLVRIPAPPVGEISFTTILELIEELSARGFNIRLVTFDRHGSQMPIQLLREKGYICEVMSIDRTDYIVKIDRGKPPYYIKHESTKKDYAHTMRIVKDAILTGRMICPWHEILYDEIKSLEEDPVGNIVAVAPGHTDDMVQTLAGACTNLWHNERIVDVNSEFTVTPEVLDAINREKSFKSDFSVPSDGIIPSDEGRDRW